MFQFYFYMYIIVFSYQMYSKIYSVIIFIFNHGGNKGLPLLTRGSFISWSQVEYFDLVKTAYRGNEYFGSLRSKCHIFLCLDPSLHIWNLYFNTFEKVMTPKCIIIRLIDYNMFTSTPFILPWQKTKLIL